MTSTRSDSAAPLVSVGVPVFNGARFIEETLRSIEAQTYRHIEITISDNASTDDTPAICQEFAARNPRIRYVRQSENMGAARNFNAVARLARGPFFKLANADDLCDPRLVERCLDVLMQHPAAVCAYAKTSIINEDSVVVGQYEDGMDLPMASPVERYKTALANVGLVNIFQGVMRTEALRRTRLNDDYPGADMVLASELALEGPIMEIGDRLFFRRVHKHACSQITDAVQRQAHECPSALWRAWIPTWSRMAGHTRSVVESGLSLRDKLELLECIGLEAVWRRTLLKSEGTAFVGQYMRGRW